MGDPQAAREPLSRSFDFLRSQFPGGPRNNADKRHWAGKYTRLGEVLMRTGNATAARTEYTKALGLRWQLFRGSSPTPDDRRDYPISLVNLGDLTLLVDRDPTKAAKLYAEALAHRRAIFAGDKGSKLAQGDVADTCYKLATVLAATGEAEEAAALFRECRNIRRRLAPTAGVPANLADVAIASAAAVPPTTQSDLQLRVDLMLALARCGEADEAASIARDIATKAPENPAIHYFAGCGLALASAGGNDTYATEAAAAINRAVDKGWKDRVMLDCDPDLDPVRKLDAFIKAVDRLPAVPLEKTSPVWPLLFYLYPLEN
jgi:hypothetical protein